MYQEDIYKFAKRLWPINRSLTGEGNRLTLLKIKKVIKNLKIKSVKTGQKFFDWNVPKEWKVKKAYIITPDGKKICDFSKNNLHLVGYSHSIDKEMSLVDLKKNLYFIKEQPDAIPYVTSYYEKNWGFCISYNEYKSLKNGKYKVIIDTNLFDGLLNYGELVVKGVSNKEIFLSSYICHPSMANNEISGITVLTFLTKYILSKKNYYTYRIVFAPETIGSIVYLGKNLKKMKKNIFAGYVLTCLGDERNYSFLPSKYGNTLSDKVAKHVISRISKKFKIFNWRDRGSDERQYCAPGIDLPIASVMRTKYGCYPEYHTSLDRFDTVVTKKGLEGGLDFTKKIIDALENNFYINYKILCEPNLGKRGLYPKISKKNNYNDEIKNIRDILSWADGKTTLIDIAEMINVPIWDLYNIVKNLSKKKLISLKRK